MWPSSGRFITKNTYIEILQTFLEPVHTYKILNFKNNPLCRRELTLGCHKNNSKSYHLGYKYSLKMGLSLLFFPVRIAHASVDTGCVQEGPHAEWPRMHNYIINLTAQSSDTSHTVYRAVLMKSIDLFSHAASLSHERRGNDALRVVSRDAGPKA
jgi:hypothetical protein